jgi:hypothetical protein
MRIRLGSCCRRTCIPPLNSPSAPPGQGDKRDTRPGADAATQSVEQRPVRILRCAVGMGLLLICAAPSFWMLLASWHYHTFAFLPAMLMCWICCLILWAGMIKQADRRLGKRLFGGTLIVLCVIVAAWMLMDARYYMIFSHWEDGHAFAFGCLAVMLIYCLCVLRIWKLFDGFQDK